MHRSTPRHLALTTAMILGVGAACAPIAWLLHGVAGLVLVALCGVAVLSVALLSDLLVWLLRGSGGPAAMWMVAGAACRMAFVVALLIYGLKFAPEMQHGIARKYIAVYIIPFYFGLLAVEVFTARTILSVSDNRQPTPPGEPTPHASV